MYYHLSKWSTLFIFTFYTAIKLVKSTYRYIHIFYIVIILADKGANGYNLVVLLILEIKIDCIRIIRMVDTKVEGYAGNITPTETWKILKNDEYSILIDVRSAAEWAYVGVTDLASIDKKAITIEWKIFPDMTINPDFINQVKQVCASPDIQIFSLCRSGQRSIATSRALTEAGFKNCYNVLEGFEGDKDSKEHRSYSGGWKFCGLPWKQN
jgi:rhodanese-related sulfurtransferase